jgi:hypothetical protein
MLKPPTSIISIDTWHVGSWHLCRVLVDLARPDVKNNVHYAEESRMGDL